MAFVHRYLNCLERLKASIDPNVDDGVDRSGDAVEGIGDHQEMVRSNSEELPVVGSRCRQQLVNLKGLSCPVPLVDDTVYGVIVVT